MNIGVFDSGLGGLWILKHVREFLPDYDYVFYGDQKHVPYGTKSKVELFAFTTEALAYMYSEQNCKAVLLACNTTSTAIYDQLKQWVNTEYPDRLLFGIAAPTVEYVKSEFPVFLFGTPRTIESGFYKNLLLERGIKTEELALPELASIIESGGDVSLYLEKFSDVIPVTTDTAILGCTHYGIALDVFKKVFPKIKNWVVQEEIIPHYLDRYLEERNDFKKTLSENGTLKIFVTGQNSVFEKYCSEWFSEKVNIEYI